MKKNKVITLKVIVITLLVLLTVSTIVLDVLYSNGIRYDSELGFFDNRYYHITFGEILNGDDVHYMYTNLNLVEILQRVFG